MKQQRVHLRSEVPLLDRNDFVSQRLVANAVTLVLILNQSLWDEISDFLPNSWNPGDK
jgi:hypothetical protein